MRELRSREVKLGSVPWNCNPVSLTSGPVLPSTSQSSPRGGELPGAPAVPCPTLTPRPSYRYVSQPPAALTPSPPLSSQCQVSPGQATPRLETILPPQEAANIRAGRRCSNNLALELQREKERTRRSGPPDPRRLQGVKRSIKMHSAGAQQRFNRATIVSV